MRVLQLIDSLEPGGAERVAVNLANGLAHKVESSFLCTTRKEGTLKNNIAKNVNYLFLKKNAIFDVKAIRRLNSYVKQQRVEIIHAHSTSFLFATIITLLNRNVSLVWHEHYGNREQTSNISKFILKICSYFFSCIITVSASLKSRSENKLLTKKVFFLRNYSVINALLKFTTLYGEPGNRILCLANFRSDKDHLTLLRAFSLVLEEFPKWSLHLVGKDFEDAYAKSIRDYIKINSIEKNVFVYGSRSDISNILSQSSMGVLSSKSEGLPISLLEYGMAGLPVIVTDVGDCREVVLNNICGLVVPKEDPEELAKGILLLMKHKKKTNTFGHELKLRVQEKYSETKYIENLLSLYNTL